jgi:hypothetical protein
MLDAWQLCQAMGTLQKVACKRCTLPNIQGKYPIRVHIPMMVTGVSDLSETLVVSTSRTPIACEVVSIRENGVASST